MGRRTVLAVITVLTLAVSGCVGPNTRWSSPTSGTTPSANGTFPAGTIAWRPCPEVARDILKRSPSNVAYDCGTVTVPQDWAKPNDGKTFGVAVMRARAAGQADRIGSLLVDPGGPGASGVELAAYLSIGMPAEVTRRFDIVGFDPRGIGRSEKIKCFSDADLDTLFGMEPDPVSQEEFDKVVAFGRKMAQSCGDKYGDTLPLFSTEQAARDMDAIRIGVGDEKMTYLGYSYGTLLGAVYAQLFPTRVRALVLDGAIDPRLDSVASTEGQARGFEKAFDNMSNWCKGNAQRCPIAPDARKAVVEVLDTARRNPAKGAGGRVATSGWVFTAVIASLYSQERWPELANAIDSLRRGNPSGMFRLADSYAERDPQGKYSNLFDANIVVNCTDEASTPPVDRLRQLQNEWRQKYPLFGASSALDVICAQWPGKRDPYPTGPATGSPPILVVGTLGDPATPYEQTPKLAEMLGVGVVLTWQGEGHTAYPQTRCITTAVNKYLIEGAPPANGTACPAR